MSSLIHDDTLIANYLHPNPNDYYISYISSLSYWSLNL